MMVDPFAEARRRIEPVRNAVAFSEYLSTSPLFMLFTVLAAVAPPSGALLTAAGFEAGPALFRIGMFFALVSLTSLVASPVFRRAEDIMSSRLGRFSGRGDPRAGLPGVRSVTMSAVVRGFMLRHTVRYSERPRTHLPHSRPDPLDEVVAERLLNAVQEEAGGVRLLAVLSALANRAEVLAVTDVPAAEVLEVLDGLPEDRCGLAQGLARMLVAEVWDPVSTGPDGRVVADLMATLRRVSVMSEAQTAALRSFLRGSWSGSVGDLLEVSEQVGG